MTVEELDIDLNDPTQIAAEIRKIPADEFIQNSYGPYAYYTFQQRALIGDDGLKPVNRRILYSMLKYGITPNHQHQKAAKLAGFCTTWHPHGNASIEEALARMGQKFSMRVPLIDPHGSVGFVTGDEPAAARYWEARMTPAAMELLNEIKDGAVELGQNYDGTEDEPAYLPVRFPNNIINGSQGIAVGYSSNMPPHNPTEVMNAVLLAIKKPDFSTKDLLKVMPGPDFPTGGELLGVDGIEEYYESGSGKFTVRGKYDVETLSRGKVKINFYELPFQVSAEKVIDNIKVAQKKDQLKDIANVKDLTDRRKGLSLSIETKAGTNYKTVINEVFRITQAESSFSVNNTVLVDGSPTIVSIAELIRRFVEFRRACIVRKANHRVDKIDARIHQLQGLLAALVDIDKCISIIRNADSPDSARSQLQKEFKIDRGQADYILSMQLRRLTKADSIALEKENEDLGKEKSELTTILEDAELIDAEVEKEIRATLKVIKDERRTVISSMTAEEVKEHEKAVKEAEKNSNKNLDCWVTRFADGRLVKTLTPYTYKKGTKRLDNGPIVEQIKMQTQDNIVIIGSDGIGRKIPLSYMIEKLPSGAKDYGVLFPDGVVPVGVSKEKSDKKSQGIIMMTNKGNVKIAKTEYPNRDEFPVFNITDDNEHIVNARWIESDDGYVVSIASDSNLLCFKADEVRASGAAAGGVRGQKLAKDSEVIYFNWLPKEALTATNAEDAYKVITQANSTAKMTLLLEYGVKGRGTQGMRSHPFKKGETKLKNAYAGQTPTATLRDKSTPVNIPMLSKRTTIGSDLKFDIDLGEHIEFEGREE